MNMIAVHAIFTLHKIIVFGHLIFVFVFFLYYSYCNNFGTCRVLQIFKRKSFLTCEITSFKSAKRGFAFILF